MFQAYSVLHLAQTGYFLHAVIVKHVGIHKQCVALLHLYVAKGIHLVFLVVEMCAVAVHIHIALAEFNVATQHLILWMHLVERQTVGIFKEYFAFLVAVGSGDDRLDGIQQAVAENQSHQPNCQKA